jgi:hypothetical protein
MIYLPDREASGDGSAELAARVAAQIREFCCEEDLLSSERVDEMAWAVAKFVSRTAGALTADTTYLVALASQALRAVGERQAARRVLVHGTGMVRPAYWEVTGNDAMWVVDLRQMTFAPGAALELIFFGGLMAVIEAIAEVWDATQGAGALGLRHVSCAAAALFGERQGRRRAAALAREIRSLCAARLDGLKERRGWTETPVILDLDPRG